MFDCSNLTNLTLVTTKLRSKTNGERTIPHGFLDDQCYKLSACDSIIFSAIKIDFDFIDSSINKWTRYKWYSSLSVKIFCNFYLLTFNLISISFAALALGNKSLCTIQMFSILFSQMVAFTKLKVNIAKEICIMS